MNRACWYSEAASLAEMSGHRGRMDEGALITLTYYYNHYSSVPVEQRASRHLRAVLILIPPERHGVLGGVGEVPAGLILSPSSATAG